MSLDVERAGEGLVKLLVKSGYLYLIASEMSADMTAEMLVRGRARFLRRIANCGAKGRMLPLDVIKQLPKVERIKIVKRLRKHVRKLMRKLAIKNGWVAGGRSIIKLHAAIVRSPTANEMKGWDRSAFRHHRGAMHLCSLAERIENESY